MNYFTRVSTGIDVAPLRAQLEANPDLWDANTQRKSTGSPHMQMSDIWVRYNSLEKFRDNMAHINDEHVPIWYPAWSRLPALRPIIFDLMARVQGEMLGGVLITRIPPGGGIQPHVDTGWHVDYYSKFYLSVASAPGAYFFCGAEVLSPKPGEIYFFDNRREHSVENRSNTERITLIMCIRTDMYRGENVI